MLLLISCSTLKPELLSSKTRVVNDAAAVPVFATLHKGAKHWEFVDISNQPPEGLGIDLSRMLIINPPHSKDAVRGVMGLFRTRQRHSLLPINDPMLKFRPSVWKMTEMYTLGLIIVVPGSVFGSIFSMFSLDSTDMGWVLPLYGNSAPREYYFERIVRDAIVQDDLKVQWPVLQREYDAYLQRQVDDAKKIDEVRADMNHEFDRIDKDRIARITDIFYKNIPASFENDSGWDSPTKEDLLKWIKISKIKPLIRPQLDFNVAWPDALPAANIQQFSDKLRQAKLAIIRMDAELKFRIDESRSYIRSYAQRSLLNNAEVQIDRDNLAEKLQGWQYFEPTLPGNALIFKSGKVANVGCYCITLKAKQFFHLIPPSFHLSDQHLSVDWDGHSLVVYNQGSSKVVIDSLEVDFNGQKSHQDDSHLSAARELAAGTLGRYRGLDKKFEGTSFIVSREQANNITVPFYIGVIYHDENSQQSIKLANFESINLLTMIRQMTLLN